MGSHQTINCCGSDKGNKSEVEMIASHQNRSTTHDNVKAIEKKMGDIIDLKIETLEQKMVEDGAMYKGNWNKVGQKHGTGS